MATGIKGICYKETTQLKEFNSIQNKHSQLRNFWDETRHFTRLSSTIFDNVVYESLYGCSVPGMPDDIMGGSAKRYSSVITDSGSDPGNESKRRSIQNESENGTGREKSDDAKVVENQQKVNADVQSENQITETESEGAEVFKDGDACSVTPEKQTISPDTDTTPVKTNQDMVRPEVIVVEADLSSDKLGQETDLSNGKISAANSAIVDESNKKVPKRVRSNSELCLGGRSRRNSSQIDITSTPLYKEIYANNLRQYGFLLAKKLGISNQSPKELRATYLQNRQKAELRREQANNAVDDDEKENGPRPRHGRSNSFADFGRRLNQCAPRVPIKDESVTENEESKNTCQQRSSTNDGAPQQSPKKPVLPRCNTIDTCTASTKSQPRMRRSNTIEYLDRCKDKPLPPVHSRSASDVTLTNKYSNSLTNISEIFDESKIKSRRSSCLVERRTSCSPTSTPRNSPTSTPRNSPTLGNSSETIDKDDESSDAGSEEKCHERQHSGSFGSDNEMNQIQATPVIMRRLKKINDPHKRLSVPLLNANNQTNSSQLDDATKRLSTPDPTEESKSVMSSLSVPDLYHQSSFGKDKLMDAYCKQEVPRRKLSVDSLRRHNEAKERLERRMSKLKSFEGVLTEADSFMKDIQTRKAAAKTIPEEAIPE